ncbi:hypothetical protein Taro_030104 [Colocasia esculenta]|uniref:Neprosin PEP catalytic domain-containing protein n=1 Tax=Colocasia esculenta TaxID=4460 RepID=A0A843VN37_COLES|nr:hypothetical protein [Colocasia esculenta]
MLKRLLTLLGGTALLLLSLSRLPLSGYSPSTALPSGTLSLSGVRAAVIVVGLSLQCSMHADGKGCFNFNCRGFIQTNRQHIATAILHPVSQYLGPQFAVTVEIIRDATGKWWVRRQGQDIGYWPRELVPALDGGAQWIAFGGEVVWDGEGRPHTATDMGSGRYPGGGFRKAAFFKNVVVLNPQLVYEYPKDVVVSANHEECYDLKIGGTNDRAWGYFFFYGGPGRTDRCT